jgi:hypothetical protein
MIVVGKTLAHLLDIGKFFAHPCFHSMDFSAAEASIETTGTGFFV